MSVVINGSTGITTPTETYTGSSAPTNGLYLPAANSVGIVTNSTEAMRIDSSGNLLVNQTSTILSAKLNITWDGSSAQGISIKNSANSSAGAAIRFIDYLGNYTGGGIYYSSSNSINYASSSDYRLKENIQPMRGALATIAQLNPVTYTWKTDGSDGQGFIAHELQAVVPDCVVGEKDAVDAEGNPQYQGVDTSFLVATLTAAIQELNAKVEAQAAEIAALKGIK